MQVDESESHSQVAIGGQSVIHRLAHQPSLQQGNTKQPAPSVVTRVTVPKKLLIKLGTHFTFTFTETSYRRHFAHPPPLPAATLRNFDNTVLSGRSLGRFLTQVKTRTVRRVLRPASSL
ncbi:hypothetical protein PoB_006135700 [Plakobranchus ocellatus]|uniref:Uncharacterized protein n=1 Tax=Plakobranchus ocellatus TaxID=259542 RepID=A0AAV4CSI1_9GAST|nr:hypothetical protein PoB_006135700 [Plakobranchus ocellatus]